MHADEDFTTSPHGDHPSTGSPEQLQRLVQREELLKLLQVKLRKEAERCPLDTCRAVAGCWKRLSQEVHIHLRASRRSHEDYPLSP